MTNAYLLLVALPLAIIILAVALYFLTKGVR